MSIGKLIDDVDTALIELKGQYQEGVNLKEAMRQLYETVSQLEEVIESEM